MSEPKVKNFYRYLDEEHEKLSIGLLISFAINLVLLSAAIVYQKLHVPEKPVSQDEAMVILNLQQEE